MRRHTRATFTVALALIASTTAFIGCSDDDTITGAGVVSPIASDANIVALLHESNLGEIQAGTVASSRATDAGVKAFAQMMVTDHTTLDQQGNTLAAQQQIAPVLPDSTLPRLQAQEMATLNATTTGTTFDRTYISQQIAAHQRTLAIIDASLSIAQNAALRTMLQNQVRPAVAAHLQTAQALQTRLGGP